MRLLAELRFRRFRRYGRGFAEVKTVVLVSDRLFGSVAVGRSFGGGAKAEDVVFGQSCGVRAGRFSETERNLARTNLPRRPWRMPKRLDHQLLLASSCRGRPEGEGLRRILNGRRSGEFHIAWARKEQLSAAVVVPRHRQCARQPVH